MHTHAYTNTPASAYACMNNISLSKCKFHTNKFASATEGAFSAKSFVFHDLPYNKRTLGSLLQIPENFCASSWC